MKNLNYLIGKTEDNEYVFVNVRLNKTVGISLDVVSPMVITDDLKEELIDSFVDGIDKDLYIQLLEEYDVKPSELENTLVENMEITELIDNSLYDEEFNIHDNNIIMESISCGQCKEYLDNIITPMHGYNFIEYIRYIWNKYHLKEIDNITKEKIEENIKYYVNDVDYSEEYSWIESELKKEY